MKTTTLITGASGGIGEQFALIAAAAKHDLVLVARNGDKLKALCEKISTQYQVKADYVIADLSKPGSADALYQEVIKRGHQVNYLINNAGVGDYGNFIERDLAKTRQIIHLNITSLVELTWLFVNDMVKAKKGGVLTVASTAAMQPDPYLAVYGATKSFVASFTEALSYEIKNTGVTATVLSPGPTVTDFFDAAEMRESKMVNSGMMPAHEVAKIGFEAMLKGKIHVVAGLKNRLLGYLSGLVPPSNLKLRIAAGIIGKK